MEPLPEPPIDRPTKMRWGCVLIVVLLGGSYIGGLRVISFRSRWSARIQNATIHAQEIHQALMLYANDHEGRFPEGAMNSNEAFRQLFTEYLLDEKYFSVPGSAWHAAAPGQRPDEEIGVPPKYDKALRRGENHWAYVSGLGQTSDGSLPLIADGFVEGAPGTYTDDPTKKGGVWKGAKAIVVLVSGSAKAYPLSAKPGFRVLRADPTTGAQVDLFELPAPPPGSAGPRILNPE